MTSSIIFKNKFLSWIILILLLFLSNSPKTEALTSWKEVEPGILFYEATTDGILAPIKIWIYLPKNREAKIPCVFITPAGSALYHGMSLDVGDRVEHLPYVRAGFAVVAYDTEGPVSDNPGFKQINSALNSFMKSKAGVLNGRIALNYALGTTSSIDQNKLFTVGHSSAATTALQLAASEPRIKACVAFAPCVDPYNTLGDQLTKFEMLLPGFKSFMKSVSPINNTNSLNCPVMLFSALDDDIVQPKEIEIYADKLKQSNKSVKLINVPTGGHYDSMLNVGINEGIKFLKSIK